MYSIPQNAYLHQYCLYLFFSHLHYLCFIFLTDSFKILFYCCMLVFIVKWLNFFFFLAEQERISILKYTQSGKTKLLVIASQRKSEKYIFLKSTSDTEIRRETSEREDNLLTSPWVGETLPPQCHQKTLYRAPLGPFAQPSINKRHFAHPLPVSLMRILSVQSHRAPAQNGAWLIILLSNSEFLNNFSAKSPEFSFWTPQILQTRKLCSWPYLH